MEEVTTDYASGVLQPGDIKLALAKSLNKILQVTFFSLAWQPSFISLPECYHFLSMHLLMTCNFKIDAGRCSIQGITHHSSNTRNMICIGRPRMNNFTD